MSYYLLPGIQRGTIHENFLLEYVDGDGADIEPVINNSLQQYLSSVKLEISNCAVDWDSNKKYTNPYEYIHTVVPGSRVAICKYKPLSRSYFKMVEMLKSLYILDGMAEHPIRTFHLAEGPGGFVEAVCNSRDNPDDVYHGMTLISDRDYVPGWKKGQEYLSAHPQIRLVYGKDNTGDILKPDNFDYCYENYRNSMDLVTGDGGFDFSVNFNDQEKSASRLIFAQIAHAMILQRHGGTFIIKFFDIFTSASIDFTYLLSCLYKKVYVIKPNTSRYANSERYLVCKSFQLEDSTCLYSAFRDMLVSLDANPSKSILRILDCDISYFYLTRLEEYNAIIGQQQKIGRAHV